MNKRIRKAIGLVGNLLPVRTKLSSNCARSILQQFSPKPIGCCWTNNKVDLQYDLQIIIPCYNVEKWVEKCLESILNQKTKYKVLISIVNDGSLDRTESIIKKAMVRYDAHLFGKDGYTLELITQENRGLSGARNIAFKHIKGTYITFLDSDDILTKESIDKMLDSAFLYDAEILQGSWYEFLGEAENGKESHIVSTTGILNDNRNVFSGFACGKLYKYNVLENFQFPEGYLFEDTPICFMLAALPYRCVAINDIIYGYRLNPEGITATINRKRRSVESYWITENCLEEFEKFGLQYDQRAYEYLLRQSITNESRVRHQPYRVRKAIFVMTVELMQQYFPEFRTQDNDMRWLEQALKNRQFVKFDLGTLGK